MRILLFTELTSEFGRAHFKKLLSLDEDIVAVVTSPPEENSNVIKQDFKLYWNILWGKFHREGLSSCIEAVVRKAFKDKDIVFSMRKRKIPHFQPFNLKAKHTVKTFHNLNSDLIISAAYTRILPPEIIKSPKLAAVNFHPSLLPHCRGCNPWFWSIATGEEYTGVTAHFMLPEVDAGDIILQKKIKIDSTITYGRLYRKSIRLSTEILREILEYAKKGAFPRTTQRSEEATYYSHPLKKDRKIDWNASAIGILNLIRASCPYPGAYTSFREEEIGILDGIVKTREGKDIKPGKIRRQDKHGILVDTGAGDIVIRWIKLSDGKEIPASTFIKRYKVKVGECFS